MSEVMKIINDRDKEIEAIEKVYVFSNEQLQCSIKAIDSANAKMINDIIEVVKREIDASEDWDDAEERLDKLKTSTK